MWGVGSLCPGVFDRQLISGEVGGYLAGYTPIWPGHFRPARSEPCSFADADRLLVRNLSNAVSSLAWLIRGVTRSSSLLFSRRM